MIHIKRPPMPEVLATNQAAWTAAYLEKRETDPKARPNSKQYAHRDVVTRLESMSHGKCFYCECSLRETKREVDHYLECAENPELAFEWSNLYLACWDCNHKKDANCSTPVSGCVDPCDNARDPADHLRFEEHFVRMRDEIGEATIRKYKLGRGSLDYQRLLRLHVFHKELLRIKTLMLAENRPMHDSEIELLRSFALPDAPFSLMFRSYLPLLGL